MVDHILVGVLEVGLPKGPIDSRLAEGESAKADLSVVPDGEGATVGAQCHEAARAGEASLDLQPRWSVKKAGRPQELDVAVAAAGDHVAVSAEGQLADRCVHPELRLRLPGGLADRTPELERETTG